MNKKYNKPLTVKEIAAITDSEIDYSDIPELGDRFWNTARLVEPRSKQSKSRPISELTKGWSQERLDAVEGRVEEIRSMLIAGEKSGISA